MSLQIVNLTTADAAACGISLSLETGSSGVLLDTAGGASEALFREIAGENPAAAGRSATAGSIRVNGVEQTHLIREHRAVARIRADCAQASNKRLVDCVRQALKDAGVPRNLREARAKEGLDAVGLGPVGSQRLSGDVAAVDRWRLSAAVAIGTRKPVWLVDEPAGNLPPERRAEWLRWLLALARKLRRTVLARTKTPQVAFATGGWLGVLACRRLVQSGSSIHIYRRPVSVCVAEATGPSFMAKGTFSNAGAGEAIVSTAAGEFRGALADATADPEPGTAATVITRPECWHLDDFPPEENCLRVRIVATHHEGPTTTYDAMTDTGTRLTVTALTGTQPPTPGAETFAWIAPEDVTVVVESQAVETGSP